MSDRKDGAATAGVVGVGVAACAVCRAGPILGFLAAVGIGTLVGFALFGVVGVVTAAVIGVVLHRRRQRRVSACAPRPSTVTVALSPPTARPSRTPSG